MIRREPRRDRGGDDSTGPAPADPALSPAGLSHIRRFGCVRNSLPGQGHGWGGELVVAALTAVALVVVSGHIPAGQGARRLDLVGFGLLVAAGVSMGVCRRWPRAATVVVTVVLCVFTVRAYPNGPVWVTGWVALAVLAWRTNRRTAVLGAAGMLVALSTAAVVAGYGGGVVEVVFVGWSAAAIFGADALRSRRDVVAGLRERAQVLERTREQESARRVAEERLRIARDLHDSVAHAMATINVQAGAAAHVLARRPEVAGEALAAIQRASGEVLDELTALLSVLREDGQAAERVPTPGIWDIARLVDGTVNSGLAVTLSFDAPPQEVAPAISTAAYRVVQESLTNVLRHSVARTARVGVTARSASDICVRVVDGGPARPGPTAGTGVGILGMRERVTSTGGTFEAGPSPDGGFAVQASWVRPT